ncbi:MAG TPA: kelch repeat-containing protein, partial [archaeon]|nr:kelch repeat-containing protein [archaeon]
MPSSWSIEEFTAGSVEEVERTGAEKTYELTTPKSMRIKLTIEPTTNTKYPIVIDPAWTDTGSLGSARSVATITHLGNGKILMSGGYDGTSLLSSSELYDPDTGT